MPGTKWKRSLQSPKVYERLREKGFSKESAAKISNSQSPGHKVEKEKKR